MLEKQKAASDGMIIRELKIQNGVDIIPLRFSVKQMGSGSVYFWVMAAKHKGDSWLRL